MPEYLAPGVFVEETSFRSKSIEGVGTSVAGIVGPTRTGPLRGVPTVVTSFSAFQRFFGDAGDLELLIDGSTKPVPNHTALAARAFFDNGGKQLYVARIVEGVNQTDVDGSGGSAGIASRSDAGGTLKFTSRFPGAAGNVALELHWRDSENLLRIETTTTPRAGESLLLSAGPGIDVAAFKVAPTAAAQARFPLKSLTAVVTLVEEDGKDVLVFDPKTAKVVDKDDAEFTAGLKTKLLVEGLPARFVLKRATVAPPVQGKLADGAAVVLRLNKATDLTPLAGESFGSMLTLLGTLEDGGASLKLTKARNPGLAADLTFPVAALAAAGADISFLMAHRTFDLDVLPLVPSGEKTVPGPESIYTYGGLTTAASGDGSLEKGLEPVSADDRLAMPVACKIGPNSDDGKVLAAIYELLDADLLNPGPSSGRDPRYVIKLAGGTDGGLPTSVDYAGETDDKKGSTGLASFETVEDISIVMTPAAVAGDRTSHQAVVLEVQKHCRKMRYRVGIVDSRQGMGLSDVRDWRSEFSDTRLALYYPWVVIGDPELGERAVPPSGFLAGVYARTDVNRGVHKAPANEVVLGALRFEQEINKFQQELLNPSGVNCLRSFPGRGHRVWGGRTLSDDPEWKYVNVRRYFLYLERSIDRSTQWVVFEPNGEQLWDNVRATVDSFLNNEWRNGRLLGGSPKEAYFVRCDRTTMTQNDLDNGRLVCLIGVAALTPAEFVVFRIGQKTADA